MRAILDGDLIVGTMTGSGFGGPEVPEALRLLPLDRLRYDGASIIDAGTVSQFYIDAAGNKRLAPGDGRQMLSCRWDDAIVKDGGLWKSKGSSDVLAAAIKAECGRRILSVASSYAQMNLAAAAASGRLSTTDKATYKSFVEWVESTLATSRALIADSDEFYAYDGKWVPVPGAVADLISRF